MSLAAGAVAERALVAGGVEAALRDPALDAAWRTALDEWEGATADERALLLGYADGVRAEVLGILAEVTGEADRRAALALLYLHLRSQWALLNIQIGYQVNAGVWDPRLILQASLLSLTFGAIEDGLPAEGLGHLKSLLHLLPSDPQGAVADVLEAPAGASGDPLLRARLHALQVDLARHERERRRLAEEVGAGDDDAGRMVRHVRETGARLADRERELAALRADRESLARACGLPEDADTATVGERVLALQARAAAEEARAARLAADRDLIRREVGASEPAEVVGLVAGLRARVARLEREQTAITADRDLLRNLCGIPAGGAADDDVLRSVAAHVRDLRDAVAERDEQVCELRALRERLIEEVGTADPDGIAEEVRALRANLARALQGVAGLLGDLEGGLSAGAAPLPPLPASLTGGNGGDNKR